MLQYLKSHPKILDLVELFCEYFSEFTGESGSDSYNRTTGFQLSTDIFGKTKATMDAAGAPKKDTIMLSVSATAEYVLTLKSGYLYLVPLELQCIEQIVLLS